MISSRGLMLTVRNAVCRSRELYAPAMLSVTGKVVDFRSCEQECAYAEDITRRGCELAGSRANGLNAAEAAILVDVSEQARPGFFDDREILLAVEDAVANSPG